MKSLNKNLILIAFLGLTPLLWFVGKDGSLLINGVDTNFPLNPLVWFLRRFFVWNNISNAGGDFSSSTAGLFFHFIQVVPYVLGLGLKVSQIFSLVFWFLLIVLSSYFFSTVAFRESYLSRVVFVIFYSFNVYLFNTWENVKVSNLSLVSAIPLGLAILILLNEKTIRYRRAMILAVVTGIVLSGGGINPAYFLCFFLIAFLFQLPFVILRSQERKFFIKNFLFLALVIFLVNFFWIIPTLNFIIRSTSSQNSISSIGFTDWIISLSENTSLLNVLRLQGAWDWYAIDQATDTPTYIPYATNYFRRFPFIAFSFAIPILAAISFVLRDKNKKNQTAFYFGFALMIIIGTFLGAGAHPPTGEIFIWMTKHIPFFSFFRSPWYIFTPLLTLAYASLLSLLLINLVNFFDKSSFRSGKILTVIFFIAISIGNLFYSYPLVTGKIFRTERSDTFLVKFPEYLFDTVKWLESQPEGRVISYPDDEIENYKWGYRGIESILSLASSREVLFPSLNTVDAPVSKLLKTLYLALKTNRIDIVKSVSYKLNADYIFEKLDQNTLASDLPLEVRSWEKYNFNQWNIYKIPFDLKKDKIFSVSNIFFGYPFNRANDTVAALNPDEHIVNPLDSEVNRIPKVGEVAGKVIMAENLQVKDFEEFAYSQSKLSNRLEDKNIENIEYVFEIPHEGDYAPVLEKYKLEDFGIIPSNTLTVAIDGRNQEWVPENFEGSFVRYNEHFFSKGEHRVLIMLKKNNLLSGIDFEGNVNFEKTGKGAPETRYEIVKSEENSYLSIHNLGDGDSYAAFTVPSFDPFTPYFIRLKYRQIYGNNAAIHIGQDKGGVYFKSQIERPPNYPEWHSFNFYYETVKVDSNLVVQLSSPYINDPLGTKVLYDDLEIYRVFKNQLMFVQKKNSTLSSPEISYKKISPVSYNVEVKNDKDSTPHILVFSENYSPFWEIKVFEEDGAEINKKPLHFSVNTYANGWYVSGAPSSYTAHIRYKTQNLFYIGAFAAIVTIIFSILLHERQNA